MTTQLAETSGKGLRFYSSFMSTNARTTRFESVLLLGTICTYGAARLCQLCANHLPILLTVVLHVAPPAFFAVLHGRLLYGVKGMATFVTCCLCTAAFSESISLRTGVPFGSYYFTGVMGPQVLGLPLLLVLAYVGIAYCSWTLASLVLNVAGRDIEARDLFFVPVLASSVFLAWDLAMEPDWSTIDRAWVWRHGGPYFGVPVSNFAGWFLTAWVFFSMFAIYLRRHRSDQRSVPLRLWRYPVLMYGLCALGNLLIHLQPMAADVVTDATDKPWHTQMILLADSATSILIMGGFVALAWKRMARIRVLS